MTEPSAAGLDVFYPIVPDAEWLARLVPLGVRTVQLRLKGAPRGEIRRQIAASLAVTREHNCELVVKNARNQAIFNLMWPLLGDGQGTYYYENKPNLLDQFMVSRSILTGTSGFKLMGTSKDSARIERFPEMTAKGTFPKPVPFGRPSAKNIYNPNGYSDHWPVSLVLRED